MSSSPSVTYKDFLTTLASDLATEYSTYKVTLEPIPRYRGYGDVKLTVCPAEPCIEYIDTGAATKTERAYWVWYYARIYAFIAITDKNFEDSLTGVGAKKGVVEVLETAFDHLVGNFLSLSLVREVNVVWDNPAIYTPIIEEERESYYAAMGSFIYKAKLKQVASTEEQATPPTISNVQSSPDSTTCTITWDTDKNGTSWVKYGEGEWPPDWTDSSTETSIYQTSHSVELTGLSAGTTYYYKPWSKSEEGWYGQTPTVYSFETSAAEDINFSGYGLSKNPILQTVIISWDTDLATKDKSRWRGRGTSDAWTYTTLSVSYTTAHNDNTSMACTPGVSYECQVYGITELGTEEWDVLKYIKISEEGEPIFDT